ncbi:MAG: hypothetical protein WAM13_19490 [Candidatus Sulfotelmatobacter sp.]|jgi:hypothetical protein
MFPKARQRFERARLEVAAQGLRKIVIPTGASHPQRGSRAEWRDLLFPARASAAIALLVLTFVSPFSARAQKPAGASVTASLPPGAMQQKATTACLECHEARIILQQRLSKAAWAKEVDKMTKWGAVVDPADRDALIDYLSTNFSPDKPAYEPRRTSAGKSNSANSSK